MLRRVSDAYTIKRELWMSAAYRLVGLVAGIIMQSGSEDALLLTINILAHLAVFQALTWKVLTSCGINICTGTGTGNADHHSGGAKNRSAISLCDLLSHPGGVAAFEGVRPDGFLSPF